MLRRWDRHLVPCTRVGRLHRSRSRPGDAITPEEQGLNVRNAPKFERRWSRSWIRALGEANHGPSGYVPLSGGTRQAVESSCVPGSFS